MGVGLKKLYSMSTSLPITKTIFEKMGVLLYQMYNISQFGGTWLKNLCKKLVLYKGNSADIFSPTVK